MCVLYVAWQTHPEAPLVVAANRDEFHARPAAPLARWEDAPHVAAGRDLEAGGTWMGAAEGGRWAAVTNLRAPEWMNRRMPRSRGDLVADFLRGDEPPEAYAHRAAADRLDFAGFNLLVGDRDALWYVTRPREAPKRLPPGFYGISNGPLGAPWPKVVRGLDAFETWTASRETEAGFAMLRNPQSAPDETLPDTGVGIEMERWLSPIFIVGDEYGTRASTLLVSDGERVHLAERAYGPGGKERGTVTLPF